mmetsp:Transcript_15661/g.37979  ORF Transcript_15661/g.37979 Transcript_15661/m.37979 type:complete len:162 (+) Transcript_15661:199-684(+)
MMLMVVWGGNFVCNLVFVGTTIEVFNTGFGDINDNTDLKTIGVIVFLVPAILMLTNIVISFLVMMDYFSEEREGFYQGCVSTGTVYLMFQLLTYVVYGATLCKWDADQCDDLRYTSVVFAGMSIFSELAFFVAFSIYLAKSSPSKGFGVTRSGAKQTNASV